MEACIGLASLRRSSSCSCKRSSCANMEAILLLAPCFPFFFVLKHCGMHSCQAMAALFLAFNTDSCV